MTAPEPSARMSEEAFERLCLDNRAGPVQAEMDWPIRHAGLCEKHDRLVVEGRRARASEDALRVELANELHDLNMVAGHCSEIYMYCSDGKISKPNTLPREVISCSEDAEMRRIEEAVKEATDAAELRATYHEHLVEQTRAGRDRYAEALRKIADSSLVMANPAEYLQSIARAALERKP